MTRGEGFWPPRGPEHGSARPAAKRSERAFEQDVGSPARVLASPLRVGRVRRPGIRGMKD